MADETEIERMVVRLTGDGSSFTNMMKDGEKQAEASSKEIEKALGTITSALTSLGAAGTLKSAFSQYSEAEAGEIKLKAAIRASGQEVDSTLASFKEYANTMQEMTTLDDDAVLSLLKTATALGATGDAAKKAATEAIALGAASDVAAETALRITAAMAKGDVERAQLFSRSIKELRGVKDQSEFVAKYQQLVANGLETSAELAATASGRIKQLNNAIGNLMEDFGGVVAEAILPIIRNLQILVAYFADLSPEMKKLAVQILAVVAGVLAIGPAFAVLKMVGGAIIAPLIISFKLLLATAAALASPVGLAALAITALAAEVILLTGTGPKLVASFKAAFAELVADWENAFGSITKAVSSGDLQLAFEIAWAQIQLSFLKATATMQTGWINFKFMFQDALADMEAKNKGFWETATDVAAHAAIELALATKQMTQAQADEAHKNLNDTAKARKADDAKALADKKAALVQGARDAVNAANQQLADLEKKRGDQDEVAAWAAFFNDTLPAMAGDGFSDMEVDLKEKLKKGATDGAKELDAALAGSAEALARMSAYDDALREMREGKGGAGGAGKAAANKVGEIFGPPAPVGGQIPVGGAGFPGVIENQWVPAIKNVIDVMKGIAAEGQKQIDKELAPNWIRQAQLNAGMAIGPKEFSPEDLGLDPAAFPKKAKPRVMALRPQDEEDRINKQADQWLAAGGDPAAIELLREIRDAAKKQAEKQPGIDLAAAELEEV